MSNDHSTIRILGVDFFNDTLERALELTHEGGLFLAPSGPGLAELGRNPHYDDALYGTDYALIDSGYLALLWKRKTGEDLKRISGLKYIKALVEDPVFKRNPGQLWVMPGKDHWDATHAYLKSESVQVGDGSWYEAPFYEMGAVTDEVLLERIQNERPDYIILCIAGGKQEVLGHWLREQLDYRPAILCIGAAIAFLSGKQANIPPWADAIYIGWLLRILADPKSFFPRYWKARKLKPIVDQWGTARPTP